MNDAGNTTTQLIPIRFVDGVELVSHADGSRELRKSDGPIDSLAAAFDAIAAWAA